MMNAFCAWLVAHESTCLEFAAVLIGIVYLVVGAIVAATHHYYPHLQSLTGIGSAVLAILLWPLVFLMRDLPKGTKAGGH